MDMKFLVGFGFTGTLKVVLIIANFYCVLLLAAVLHSLITNMA